MTNTDNSHISNCENEKFIDLNTLYIQACETFRHYATKSANIRIISISQCFLLVYAIFDLIKKDIVELALIVSVFGVLLTLILRNINKAFLDHAKNMAEFLRNLESSYSIIPNNGGMLYIKHYRNLKESNNKLYDWIIAESIYLLIFFMYVVMFVISFVRI